MYVYVSEFLLHIEIKLMSIYMKIYESGKAGDPWFDSLLWLFNFLDFPENFKKMF